MKITIVDLNTIVNSPIYTRQITNVIHFSDDICNSCYMEGVFY